MLQSAGGDPGPLLMFLHTLVLHVLVWHRVLSSAQWGTWERLEVLQSLSSGSHTGEAAGHCRTPNCCPLLHSLRQMWYVCKVIGFHYLIYKVGVGGRVREDKLKWIENLYVKRVLEGAMITLYKYLEGHYEEERDQLLSLVSAAEQEVMLCAAEGKPGLWCKNSKGNITEGVIRGRFVLAWLKNLV